MTATPDQIRHLFLHCHPTYSPAEAAEAIGMSVEDVRGWMDVGELVRGYFAGACRETKASATSATSFQPLSMVSECPRLGIEVISVTPGLCFCRS